MPTYIQTSIKRYNEASKRLEELHSGYRLSDRHMISLNEDELNNLALEQENFGEGASRSVNVLQKVLPLILEKVEKTKAENRVAKIGKWLEKLQPVIELGVAVAQISFSVIPLSQIQSHHRARAFQPQIRSSRYSM